jgi:hypothetical protein
MTSPQYQSDITTIPREVKACRCDAGHTRPV